ncbi:unnamed protein product [Caretta caretta]
MREQLMKFVSKGPISQQRQTPWGLSMPALPLVLVLTLNWSGLTQGQTVIQPVRETKVKEGEFVTLDCSYNSGFPTLLWYRQESGGSPQFILQERSRHEDLEERFRNRFKAKINKTSRVFPLDISSVQLSDSATYYCALIDTVGKRIHLPLQNPSAQQCTKKQHSEGVENWGLSILENECVLR